MPNCCLWTRHSEKDSQELVQGSGYFHEAHTPAISLQVPLRKCRIPSHSFLTDETSREAMFNWDKPGHYTGNYIILHEEHNAVEEKFGF